MSIFKNTSSDNETPSAVEFCLLGGRYIKKEIITQVSFLYLRIRMLRLLITNRTRNCMNSTPRACTTHALCRVDQNKKKNIAKNIEK